MRTISVRLCPSCDFTATAHAKACPMCHADILTEPVQRIATSEYHARLDWHRDTITVTRHPGA